MKTALVFGSSGLVGGHLLSQLIENDDYNKIKIFVRSELEINDPKVEIIKTDFNNLENHKEDIKGDDCFFCIGTTKQNSPDKSEYRRVELDVPKQVAQIAKSNLVNSFVFVSSGYADPKSSGDYLKFKGEVEEELKRLNFPKLGIMRPSFLLGDRKEKRVGEKIGIFVFKLLSPLFLGPLKKMKPIHSATVAKAMIRTANENLEKNIFESNEIAELVLNQS
ncbi:NAD(P)H-binding protein [Candidatus Pelagibacter sp.]|nr:NAD(P)H-binding protein [Candidatus Pelagibacter sp.]